MKLLLIACLTVALSSISSAQAAAQATMNLQFPKELAVGRLILLKPDWKAYGESATGSPLAPARGSVKTLSGQSIMLLSNDCISEHMSMFSSFPADALACLALNSTSISDKDLVFVNHLTGLRRLEFEDTDITDAGVVQLSKLGNLEFLCLSCTLVKGNTLDSLNVPHLRNLQLDNVSLAPKAFLAISKFSELRWLNLIRSHLTDRDLAELTRLPKLEGLIISQNPGVTDAGIKQIAAMKHLRRLDLANTAVTIEGLMALKELKLKWLRLGSQFKSGRSNARLQQAFSRVAIEFDQDRPRMPTELFAPLH